MGGAQLIRNHHRCRRHVRPAGRDHPRAVVRRRRHDGRQRLKPQLATIRNLALAWVLTLPAAILLSGGLYFVFAHLF